MPGDRCDRTCTCSYTCNFHSTKEKLPVPKFLSTVQSYMPNRSFVVATATLVAVTFRFYNSSLSCFIQNDTFEVLQQQENLYIGRKSLGLHVQFQMIKSNLSCKQWGTYELMLLHAIMLLGMYCKGVEYTISANQMCLQASVYSAGMCRWRAWGRRGRRAPCYSQVSWSKVSQTTRGLATVWSVTFLLVTS